MTEEVGAFSWREACDKIAECVPERLDGSQSPGAQHCLGFGESLFDRVQVGAIGWQIEQSGAGGLDRLTHSGHLVCEAASISATRSPRDASFILLSRLRRHPFDHGKGRDNHASPTFSARRPSQSRPPVNPSSPLPSSLMFCAGCPKRPPTVGSYPGCDCGIAAGAAAARRCIGAAAARANSCRCIAWSTARVAARRLPSSLVMALRAIGTS
jgi:hypothetical protein